MKRFLMMTILAVLLVLSVAGIASAHATIDHCTPAVGSTVATSPTQVVCVMSEEIDTKQSTISILDASGAQVDKQDAHVDLNDPDHKTLAVSLDPTTIKNGVYTVKWHAITPDDGGITDGTFQFIVGSASATVAPTTFVEAGSTPVGTPLPAAAAPTTVATTTAPTGAPTAVATAASTAAPTTAPATATTASAAVTPSAPATAPTTGGASLSNLAWLGLAALVLVSFGLLVQRRAR